jgi:uncharacterized protein YbjT (DUF2867 family)
MSSGNMTDRRDATETPGEGEQADLTLVFGASGYIGSNLVPALVAAGHKVRASARHLEVLEARGWEAVELVQADALDPGSLAPALRGVDTAYYLVHSMASGRDFDKLDLSAAANFAAAAAHAGVRRIVYLGGLIPENPSSRHLISRQQTGETLRQGPVPVTEIRAGMIIGPGSAAWEVMRDLVNHLPVMVTPRWVKSRSTPIALPNLLGYLVAVAKLPGTEGQIYEVAGPETLSYAQMMRQYGELAHKHPAIIPVPVLTPRLSSYWLRFVTSVPTNVARALVEGLEHDFISRDRRLQELAPQELMDFRSSVLAAMDAERHHQVLARWVEGAMACRNFNPDFGYYAKRAGDEIDTSASAEALWLTLCKIGGEPGFFYAHTLWFLRRAMDWLIGGPSFRRRRRHPEQLRVGDVVDAWRVIAMEPGKRLTFLMEMRAPGAGVLEFSISDQGSSRHLTMYAYFHPAGAPGMLYWGLLLPAHLFLFRGTTRRIARLARDLDQH